MAGTVMGEVGALKTGPTILWLAGTFMGEVGPVTFHGAGNTVVGWHGFGRGRGHKIFDGASFTVSFNSLPQVLVHEVSHFEIQVGRKRSCTKMSTLIFMNPLFKTFQRKYVVT